MGQRRSAERWWRRSRWPDRQTDRATLGNARARHQGDPGDTAAGDERERTETRGPLSPVAGAVPRAPGTPAT